MAGASFGTETSNPASESGLREGRLPEPSEAGLATAAGRLTEAAGGADPLSRMAEAERATAAPRTAAARASHPARRLAVLLGMLRTLVAVLIWSSLPSVLSSWAAAMDEPYEASSWASVPAATDAM